MAQNTDNKKFGIKVFVISALTIFLLTALSFLSAWGRDEGTLSEDDNRIWNLLADSYDFFRQPFHGLFWDFIIKHGWLFLPGLIFNILFWSLIVERLTFLSKILKGRLRNSR
jgi:hypothetical protein